MTTALTTSLLGVIGSLLVAAFTYWTAKRREREAEWRKEKLAYYKAFIESLNGVIDGEATPDGHKLYAKTTNNLLLFAPQSVINSLNAYRSENAISNSRPSQELHDRLLADLLLAIRADVGIYPHDDPTTFKAILWASGARRVMVWPPPSSTASQCARLSCDIRSKEGRGRHERYAHRSRFGKKCFSGSRHRYQRAGCAETTA